MVTLHYIMVIITLSRKKKIIRTSTYTYSKLLTWNDSKYFSQCIANYTPTHTRACPDWHTHTAADYTADRNTCAWHNIHFAVAVDAATPPFHFKPLSVDPLFPPTSPRQPPFPTIRIRNLNGFQGVQVRWPAYYRTWWRCSFV